ncbi:hypothetical protein Cfast33896_13180 [Coprobacter fastidiosus]|nr:hypothetical protein Cfast33896_13180 [Coprobacter fastidiosus]
MLFANVYIKKQTYIPKNNNLVEITISQTPHYGINETNLSKIDTPITRTLIDSLYICNII